MLRCSILLLLTAVALPFLSSIMPGDAIMPQPQSPGSVRLPAPNLDGSMSLERALSERRSVREFTEGRLQLTEVAQLLWAAQGVTSHWGGRTAPSAGALYPLELYLVAGLVEGLPPGVYRYDEKRHQLAVCAEGDRRSQLAVAALDQNWMKDAPAIIALAAVYARTARKYGELAQRYVHMEVGHAAQNVYLQATAMGLGTCVVGAFHDGKVGKALMLPAGEAPLGLMPVGRAR